MGLGKEGGEVTDVIKSLTDVELSTLDKHEAVIKRGLNTFADVGNALLAIRDGRLYREQHGTFEDYCRERWGMTNRHANRLIESAGVVANVGPMGPKSERQARPLTRLPPEKQPEAWEAASNKAKEESRPVTARDVEVEVEKRTEKVQEAIEGSVCKRGPMIPGPIVSAIHRLRTELELCAAKAWARCDRDEVLKEIKKLERMLQ
jgi:hypothetical protein